MIVLNVCSVCIQSYQNSGPVPNSGRSNSNAMLQGRPLYHSCAFEMVPPFLNGMSRCSMPKKIAINNSNNKIAKKEEMLRKRQRHSVPCTVADASHRTKHAVVFDGLAVLRRR